MQYYFIILLSFFLNVLQAQEKTFAINRQTTFLNEKGEKLSFEDFALLTSKYKAKLNPSFDSLNLLKHITLIYPEEAAKYVGENRIIQEVKIVEQNISPKERYKNNFNTSFTDSDLYSNVNQIEGLLAPSFEIDDQYGNVVNSESLKGTVFVLKFWFSTCAPCIEEMPSLNRLVNSFQNQNVKFYAPSVENKERTLKFLNYNAFNYNVLYAAQDLAALYKTPGYPTHVVVGKDNRVRKVIVGKRTNIYKILNEEIRRALLIQEDDIDVVELDDNESFVLNDFTIILNENGDRIKKEEYIYRLKSGKYKVYKKLKKNGNINLLITKN